MTRPNSSHTGKRRKNRARVDAVPALSAEQRAACEAAIAYRFKDEKLLDRAMTHRSATQGKAVEWSNERLEFLGDRVLGLVIVDEEQHFGVKHKEKLKTLRADVHLLTLTATPIPRTLQLALSGVKEMSIIATPPVDRLAVRTFVTPFDPVTVMTFGG